ncbi:MAG: hypothetical protein H0T87_15155, partial [Gammaproteobacteria bacterium]|nr:hypothetical protein [Gammaproteobacteria bacterium]
MTQGPTWLYHATQGAKLFVTEDALEAAEALGWRDSPGAALRAIDNIDVELQAAALAGDAAYKA